MTTGSAPPATVDAFAAAASMLEPVVWAKVNALLVRKAIAEFSHERLFAPHLVEGNARDGRYALAAESKKVVYGFRARRHALDHWSIDAATIEKRVDGEPAPLDALSFIIEFQDRLGITEGMMPVYLDEVSNTLYGSAYKQTTPGRGVGELLEAHYQDFETAMIEGHPTFIANNGRIGFGADDYRLFAPEAAHPVRLVWIAVRRDRATFSSIEGLDHETLLRDELGAACCEGFAARLEGLGLAPGDYFYMPVHPWQWINRLAMNFAAEVAMRRIVFLGLSEDRYQPQQSIRTFFNLSHPGKHYLKTSISVLNMGFMRGLSPYYMLATPAVNQWLGELVRDDELLNELGFSIIREVASIGFHNRYFETALPDDSAYQKMLSALWRESPVPQLRPGQRLMTMAALLHVDPEENAFAAALIAASALDPETWLRRYLDAFFVPLVHCFYTYDLAFMPHGENLILVLEDHAPVRVIMKDIGEEIGIFGDRMELPEEIERIRLSMPDDQKLNCIFTDVFDCFFRYLAAILDDSDTLPEARFWQLVGDAIRRYQEAHPEHGAKYARYDLFAPTFTLNCLNRLQLANNQHMLNLADPEHDLQYAGSLENPLATTKNGTAA